MTDLTPGKWADLFVPANAPQYADMIEKARAADADPRDWKMEMGKDGIWVSRRWLEGKGRI